MTERELLDFTKQERRLKKLLAEYEELGNKMALPKSPNLNLSPGGGNGDERLDLIIDKRARVKSKIDECRILMDIAEKKLDRAADRLIDELQIDVFDLLYRKGIKVPDISKKLKYSESHIYRQRAIILSLVSSV